MKKLVIYFRKNTPCHKWIKCSKPVVGDWLEYNESNCEVDSFYKHLFYKIGIWNGSDIDEVTYSELMDHIYSQYVVLDRDKKIKEILQK